MDNGGENRNRYSFANGSQMPQMEVYEERVKFEMCCEKVKAESKVTPMSRTVV